MRSTPARTKRNPATGHRSTRGEQTTFGALNSGAERRLGTSETAEQQQVAAGDYRRRLWLAQEAMWSVTKNKTLAGCHRWRAPGAAQASLQWRGEGSARWASLQDSHSVWASPVSAANIASLRTAETTAAVQNWTKTPGHSVQFLTLTLRHRKAQSLKTLWDALSYCWRGVTGTAAWRGGARSQGDKALFGIVHFIKSVEATIGRHGWHVHIHALLLTDRRLRDLELVQLRQRLFDRWSAAAERKGLDAPSDEHGVDLRQAGTGQDAEDVAGYVAKGMAQSLGAEMSGGLGKVGRKKSRTPFQILLDIGEARRAGQRPDREDVALWREWEQGSRGRRQMAWSKRAKEALGIADLTDEELVEAGEEQVESWTVAEVTADQWRKIQSNVPLRLEVVEAVAAASSPQEAVQVSHEVLTQLGIEHTMVMVSRSAVDERLEDREVTTSRRVWSRMERERAWREGLRRKLVQGSVLTRQATAVQGRLF
jgi:hypothetical protein